MASSPASTPPARNRATILLVAGAGVGLLAAAVGLMGPQEGAGAGLPEGAVAAVNGRIVRVEEYQRAVAALASDRRDPIGDEERRHVLDRLLEEELLVQRGLELGLARHDRRVRGDIVGAVIQAVVSQTDSEAPSDAEILDFYEGNRDYFTRTGRLFVEQILVRARPGGDEAEALGRAEEAARRLREGEPLEQVDEALGDAQVARVPRDYLPASKLREYLGPTATRSALELAPGEVSDPVRSATGYHVLRMVDRAPGRIPPLEEIEQEVRAEERRRAGDRALREYLDDLRERADVRVVNALP